MWTLTSQVTFSFSVDSWLTVIKKMLHHVLIGGEGINLNYFF
jgi:hypothetical protein